MGADYFGQERAIEELRGMSNEAKKFLSHHIRYSLGIINFAVAQDKPEAIKKAVGHIVEDLKKIGC